MKSTLTFLLAFFCTGLYAENAIDIFDQNRGQEKKAAPVKVRAPRAKKTVFRGAEFSLSGISKIGDKYVIYFDTKKGKRDDFTWLEHQKSPPVKIYNDYEIHKIIDRTLYLNMINNKPCIEDQKKGVSCDKKNNQMVMQLVRKKAIIKPPSTRNRRKTVQKQQPNTKSTRPSRKLSKRVK
jgi:hypothetical protein